MGLLVEYSLKEGQSDAQERALRDLVAGLREEGTEGFSYTGYATDDPARFIGLFEFEDDAAKQRFLDSRAFAAYRDGAKARFTAPPGSTPIRRVASTRD
ncbi:putative quinol monooxygenase [Limimaricola pyoseonensis]|uniref:Quinol monooxygenase YgiN n=1 Tax=Limimaricola pyoseonensis TaxID=521013 RepID=A0A1G7KZU0_9RHOB|nr:antibiotic biosynthesis monooxygenase [Limimaricola pyoseonensis]SDF42269.1 Quinol monooxygenase YgiN [Limimaricola pyoseonensis]